MFIIYIILINKTKEDYLIDNLSIMLELKFRTILKNFYLNMQCNIKKKYVLV